MRKLVPALLLVIAAAMPQLATPRVAEAQQATSAPTNVDDAVNRVQNFYNQSNTFKSDFRQKFTVKAYNQEKNSAGTVTFSKPGKMDWVYANPVGNRVVSDGSNLKVYEAAEKQMFEQTVDKSQYPAVLSFLTGQGQLSQTFDFDLYSGETLHFPGGYVLVGTPKQANPAYTKVLFYVDSQTSQVRRVMVIDGQGNRNRFDFQNPRINEAVTVTQFTFSPPPGTSIVRPQ
jgi:outer membrane lipoprotein carrier protein